MKTLNEFHIAPVDIHAAIARAHLDRAATSGWRFSSCRRWSRAWRPSFAPAGRATRATALGPNAYAAIFTVLPTFLPTLPGPVLPPTGPGFF